METTEISNLNELTVSQLRIIARQKGLTGTKVQDLKKNELIEYIENDILPETSEPDISETKSDSNLAAILAAAIENHLKVKAIDKSEVENIVKETLKNESVSLETIRDLISEALDSTVKTIEVKKEDGSKKDVGLQHEIFESLLALVNLDLHVWLHGEAGSGKTHVAEAVAKALDVPFYAESVTNQTTKGDLFGFLNANGDFMESSFYKAYQSGGVFCLDEVDNGNGNVLNVINSATSNSHAFFKTGRVEKHSDFHLIACANTVGEGANRQYIGRNQLDGALKSRFTFLEMNTDWNLVKEIVKQYGKKGVEFYEICMKVKEVIKSFNMTNIMLTSRTVFDGAKIYNTGKFEINQILEMVLFKGCDASTKAKILNAID